MLVRIRVLQSGPRCQVGNETHDPPPSCVGSKLPTGKHATGQILLHDTVHFLPLAASLSLPANHTTTFPIYVGHHAKYHIPLILYGFNVQLRGDQQFPYRVATFDHTYLGSLYIYSSNHSMKSFQRATRSGLTGAVSAMPKSVTTN